MQVNSAASKETLSKAFSRLNRAQDSEYSAETLEARTHLLKAALDVLSDSTGRRLYDNAVQSGSYEASPMYSSAAPSPTSLPVRIGFQAERVSLFQRRLSWSRTSCQRRCRCLRRLARSTQCCGERPYRLGRNT